MGEAYYIEETTGTGVPEVPDVPHFIWSRLFDDDSTIVLKVTWLPALEGHPGSYFYVQYRSKGESLWKNTTAELETDYTVVMGLERNTLYEMRVVSVDGPFETPSLIVEVETESYGVPSAQVIDSAGTAPWLIALMCAIALALLIIIIICLIKRNAGGKYPVYKKEATLGSGLDYPDGGGFHEYNKPSSNHHPLKGSRTSLNSSLAGPGSDTDSMAEYGGEGDTGKFTEDGSFIGQYGRTKNAEEESRLSTAATPLV
ncbi:neuroglian-like [Limulus polyphemus]|uniref:Neuroglian-like n=1 Tax=Limulus polyphemus TaxID=6850 RepID=A0ABM1TMN6_LIMPO|nr:neuroglian-like [Limulus polyphemus]